MTLRKGDMFSLSAGRPDVILVTTNAYVKTNGCLVMGRGAAWCMVQKYPETPRIFGGLISKRVEDYGSKIHTPYGILIAPRLTNPMLGAFQVKRFFKDKADLDLIRYSTEFLLTLTKGPWSNCRIFLNFPGIGNGELRREDVLPIIECLPNNVEVWER